MSRQQLRDLGFSDSSIYRATQRGEWQGVGKHALVAAGQSLDLAALTRIVATNHQCTPTGVSAVALTPDSPWSKLIRRSAVPWLIGQRPRGASWFPVQHPGAVVVEQSGVWIADPETTLIDLMRFLPLKQAHESALIGLQARVSTWERLNNRAIELDGRRGVRQLRRVLKSVSSGAQSWGEKELIRLLRIAGITGWIANHPTQAGGRNYRIDIAFPQTKLAIEFDGRAYHSSPAHFQADRRRQNDLQNAGWRILRFTWSDVTFEPQRVISTVLAAL